MDERDQLITQVTTLHTGGPKDKPRLHKPLLVLLLLSRFIKSGSTTASFEEVEDELSALIAKYTPSASQARAIYPYWRLQTDGFWQIVGASEIDLNKSGDPSRRSLTKDHTGSWTPEALYQLQRGDPQDVVNAILTRYFASADHDLIIRDLGL